MNEIIFLGLLSQIESYDIKKVGCRLNQHIPEWKTYLELVGCIFKNRGVEKPVVVEIGILDGMQRQFYEELFNATYISIDINPKSPADIIGDSCSLSVLEKLKAILDGRKIDLLFIDGLHTYDGVKADYEIYNPMVKHITAIHDVLTPKNSPKDSVNVIDFWDEVKATNIEDTLLTIQHHNNRLNTSFNGRPLGIGVVLKGQGL